MVSEVKHQYTFGRKTHIFLGCSRHTDSIWSPHISQTKLNCNRTTYDEEREREKKKKKIDKVSQLLYSNVDGRLMIAKNFRFSLAIGGPLSRGFLKVYGW